MCNAANHSLDCPCGFGGATGGGGFRGRSAYGLACEPVSSGWAKDSRGTVESYTNPNAHCPVCGAAVFFYRSPFDGRVFFDSLGGDWPKHGCTDLGLEPRRTLRTTHVSTEDGEPRWKAEGWQPLLSANVYSDRPHQLLTGDLGERFVELCMLSTERTDRHGPILVRRRVATPDLVDVSFVRSGHLDIVGRTTCAFSPRLAPLGDDVIQWAALGDASALFEIGGFLLWSLDDPAAARPYLEKAMAGGIAGAAIALAIVAIFQVGSRVR